MIKVFIAYPARPSEIGDIIQRSAETIKIERSNLTITTWQRPDLAGFEIITPILEAIRSSDIVVADITKFNFNVTYEIGYALGLGKRVMPIASSLFTFDIKKSQHIGIYDTLIRQSYSGSDDLVQLLTTAASGQRIATDFPRHPSQLYVVLPQAKIDEYASLVSRAKKAGLRSRAFDPSENFRLGSTEAVRQVAMSAGVVIPLLPDELADAEAHNIRAAFVAGVAHALAKPTLMIKKGDWAVPLDVCEQVSTFFNTQGFEAEFSPFATRVHEEAFAAQPAMAGKRLGLAALNLGDPAAENEEAGLITYFLERGEFRQVVDGRANIVVGRKGSGKTAVYVRARDLLRVDRSLVVLSLSPEGYQLKKLKDLVLTFLTAGSKEFLLSAFWEYVLLLEICAGLIEKDKDLHKRDHTLFEPYQRLLTVYRSDPATNGLDFSDRLSQLVDQLGREYRDKFGDRKDIVLNQGALANIMHRTTLSDMRVAIEGYTARKGGVHVLFDNVDKSWNASGLQQVDVVMIRTLIDTGKKLKNDFGRKQIDFQIAVFLRNDIYDILLSATSDRGKDTKVLVDWSDRDLLKQILRKRILSNEGYSSHSIQNLWHQICCPIIQGSDSLEYLIDRSLMRPRYFLRLIGHCLGNAINFGRNRIDDLDIEKGLSLYSSEILTEINLEIQDVLTFAKDILYVFLGEPILLKKSVIIELLRNNLGPHDISIQVFTLFLWHGVIGLHRAPSTTVFIFDVNYDLRRLTGLIDKTDEGNPTMQINSAFWPGLELVS